VFQCHFYAFKEFASGVHNRHTERKGWMNHHLCSVGIDCPLHASGSRALKRDVANLCYCCNSHKDRDEAAHHHEMARYLAAGSRLC
jgi:hypothetical protein